MSSLHNQQTEFVVVVNDEGQYSIWRADSQLPLGWRATGFRGLERECLDNITEVWADMTPSSVLRQQIQNQS
jgi:MbtH protein